MTEISYAREQGKRVTGHDALIAILVQLPLALPPSVAGILLLTVFGPCAPMESSLSDLGLPPLTGEFSHLVKISALSITRRFAPAMAEKAADTGPREYAGKRELVEFTRQIEHLNGLSSSPPRP